MQFTFLTDSIDEFEESHCKIHLASWNGKHDPLNVFFAGDFEEWQRIQTRKNFERPYILSLIQLPARDAWLYAGIYKSGSAVRKRDRFYYQTSHTDFLNDVIGRLVIGFRRTGRQSYLRAERWLSSMEVREIKPERLQVLEFPGYRNLSISWHQLRLIVEQNVTSWRTALSNVAGVYLITDQKSGLLYVGSATGSEGIWQRWSQYAKNGHGGNKDLKALLTRRTKRPEHFAYSILETASIASTEEDLLAREGHWKKVLLSREFGLNCN